MPDPCKCFCQKTTLLFIITLFGLAVSSILWRRTGSYATSLPNLAPYYAPYLDPKTAPPRDASDATNVTVYLLRDKIDAYNPATSVFRTDVLRRYGTGRVRYAIHERAECNLECADDDHREPPPSVVALAPCLAVSRFRVQSQNMLCDQERVRCAYPYCKTMLANDEMCEMANVPFDVRQYYTTHGPQRGYLPLGPRWDSWLSFQKLQEEAGRDQFVIPPSSERKFAFNAVFSRSTNIERQKLASKIEVEGPTLKFPIFSSMAKEWSLHVSSNSTEQLHTDEYMRVVLDSVFTLSPAGHNPECFRIYEAVEAGSIPILTREDMRAHRHPNEKNSMALRHVPHPCANALLHWYGAPIVVLDSWNDLYPTVERLLEDPAGLDDLQRRLCHWYDEYMRMIVAKFEDTFLG